MESYEQVDFNKERKQILVYLTSSYGNTIIINLLMGGF
jgi:cytochrome c-type biogenesis protein CcmH/NrfF